jgi:MFS family permease
VSVAEALTEPREAESADAAAKSGGMLVALPFLVALITTVLTYWTIDIVSPALPDIQDDLALSAKSAGLIFSLLFLGRLIGNFPAAYFLDRLGTTGTATTGGAVLIAGTFAAAIAPSGLWLMPARVVQGIGIAFLVNACLRAVITAKPGRGAAMTYFSFAATVGGVFGLQSGGFLTEMYGWRSVFVLSTIVASVITLATIASRLRSTGVGTEASVNQTGKTVEEQPAHALAAPLLLNFMIFFNYALFVALPLYTEHHFDAPPEVNARLLMVITLVHLVAAFPAGRAIRRFGAQRSMVVGMLVAIAGTALVLVAPSPAWIALPMVLYGIGQVSATNAGGDIVLHLGGQGPKSVGFVRFSSDLGLVVGPFITGALSDAFGYQAPFVALPVLMAVAALFAIQQVVAAGDRRI